MQLRSESNLSSDDLSGMHKRTYPIRVKNTFNPKNPGTIIKKEINNDTKAIKGISSISGTTLITVTGLSMVGVIGVNRRIFTALANNGISVFMVSQASSENSTSIGMKESDSEAAVNVLNEEFAKEIEQEPCSRCVQRKDLQQLPLSVKT